MKRRFTLCCLLFASVALAQSEPKVIANINGEILTAPQFDQLWSALSPEMRKNYEESGGKITFLDNYIRKRLVVQEAIKSGLHERDDVRFEIQAARESLLFDRYVRDVLSRRVIREDQLRAFYEARKSIWDRPEMIKARHIIVTPDDQSVVNTTGDNATSRTAALEKILMIQKQLRDHPGSFVDLALQFSEDGAARSGGSLGWFGRGKMVPEFDEVVFSLGQGGISDVIETRFGWHLVRVEDRRAAGPPPFEEVREDVRNRMLAEMTQEMMAELQRYTQELREASRITIHRENL